MSLLNSLVGAVTGNANTEGSLGGLVGALGSNPQITQILSGLLANDGQHGGLGGLVSQFEQAGLGGVIGSWVGNGQNQAISGDQVTQALGSGTIGQIASKLGIDPTQAASQISSVLPALVNHLTPNGQVPAEGVGTTSDLASLLGGLFNKA